MQSLAIIKPIRSTVIGQSKPTMARLLTPDPKEAVLIDGAGHSLILDLGAVALVDVAFLGYHDGRAGQSWQVAACDANGVILDYLFGATPVEPLGLGPPYHSFSRRASPLASRYFRLDVGSGANGVAFTAGVFAIGFAWQASWGTEWGAGRLIEDTGSAERLFGGGFGIDDGVAAGGYQWTFGDLQAEELRTLYQIVKDRRTTRSVLVVEDPEQTDGLNERIHWGLFRKIDAYERLDPANTKWSLQIGDWA